jgi:hypothetical protein
MAVFTEASYWCAGGASAEVLGAYDGFDVWTIKASLLTSGDEQLLVSLHERMHHALQHATPWGLVTRFAADLARLDVRTDQFRRLFRFCREKSRRVHETFATTLTLGGDPAAQDILRDNVEYRDYFDTGMRLAGEHEWPSAGFFVDLVLQACMCSDDLVRALDRGLAGIRVTDLDHPQARPDDRLAAILAAPDLPRELTAMLGVHLTPDDLGICYDQIAGHLASVGLSTSPTATVRHLIDQLFADVADLSPQLGERLTVSAPDTDPLLDRAEEMQREAIELHHTGRLPLELVPMAQLGARAADFTRHDDRLGDHVLLVLVRADLLARQFVQPNGLTGRSGSVVALQASGYDDSGSPIARLGLFDGVGPGDVVRAFHLPVVFLTTAASIIDATDDLRCDGIETVYALVDQPVVAQLRHTFTRGARVTWSTHTVRGDRTLEVLAFMVDALPGTVWLHITGRAGMSVLTDWLRSQDAAMAMHQPDAFDDVAVGINVVVAHLVAAWFVVDQLGGRGHE